MKQRRTLKPGRLLSVICLVISAVLLVLGNMYIKPKSESWASIWTLLFTALVAYFAYYAMHKDEEE